MPITTKLVYILLYITITILIAKNMRVYAYSVSYHFIVHKCRCFADIVSGNKEWFNRQAGILSKGTTQLWIFFHFSNVEDQWPEL